MRIWLLSTLALLQATAEGSFVSFPLNKKHVDSSGSTSDFEKPHYLLKRGHHLGKRSIDNEVEMTLQFDQLMYQVEMQVGSNQNSVILLLDTASSDLVVNSYNNQQCQADASNQTDDGADDSMNDTVTNMAIYRRSDQGTYCFGESLASTTSTVAIHPFYPSLKNEISYFPADETYNGKLDEKLSQVYNCMAYGVYDQNNSTTFLNTSIPLNVTYADGSSVYGYFGKESVVFGGVDIPNTTIGLNVDSYKGTGVFGIGFRDNESPYQHGYPLYESFPYHLKSLGLIKKVVYSIYTSFGNSQNVLLFGAYLKDAYEQKRGLTLVPIVDFAPIAKTGEGPYYVSITLNAISFFNQDMNGEDIATGNAPAILDLGSTTSSIPYYIFNEILVKFNFKWSSELHSYVIQESEIPKDEVYITFNLQQALIQIPLIDFTYPVIDSNTLSNTGLRSISIYSHEDDYFLFGDDFIGSTYFVVDMEAKAVALGQVNSEVNITHDSIVVVENTIEDAVKSAAWDSIYGSKGVTSLKLKTVDDPNGIQTISDVLPNAQLFVPGLGLELSW